MFQTVRTSACVAIALTLSAVAGASTVGNIAATGNGGTSGHRFTGEVFTVPVGEAYLNSFSIRVYNATGADMTPAMILYAWDSVTGDFTGPALDSTLVNVPNGASDLVLTRVNDVLLTPGAQYAYVVDWGSGTGAGAYYNNKYYADGGSVIFSPPADPDQFVTQYDIAFEGTFSNVPAPSALMVGGLAALGVARRRR